MKKILITICLLLLMVPNMVCAKEKEKINVYMFYGDGCPHCHNAIDFFESIEEEYGKYFNLVKYETWYSHQNSKMMKNIATELKTDTNKLGVPYIIIGEQTFLGYSEAYNEDIIKAIVDSYNNEEYVDRVQPVVNLINKELKKNLVMAIGASIILVIIVGTNFILRKKYAKNN